MTHLSAKLKTRLLAAALILAALALFHAALVSSLLALDFTNAAEMVSINDPDVAEAQAQKYRTLGVKLDELTSEGQQGSEGQKLDAESAFTTSLGYWQQAISLRPSWPYYHLGALDVEVYLADKVAVQQRIKHIIQLAPNERGLDKGLLVLAVIAWQWLEPAEKQWLLNRMAKLKYSTLKYVFSYAKQADNHYDICTRLPWKKVRGLCG